jgi:hypothetical protein
VTEPIPVIPLGYADAAVDADARRRRLWLRTARICAAIAWAWCLMAWSLILMGTVKSVLFTGPVLLALGFVIVLAGRLSRRTWFLSLGAAHCAVCVLFAALVNINRWSPTTARKPFSVLGGVYVVGLAVPTLLACRPRPHETLGA